MLSLLRTSGDDVNMSNNLVVVPLSIPPCASSVVGLRAVSPLVTTPSRRHGSS